MDLSDRFLSSLGVLWIYIVREKKSSTPFQSSPVQLDSGLSKSEMIEARKHDVCLICVMYSRYARRQTHVVRVRCQSTDAPLSVHHVASVLRSSSRHPSSLTSNTSYLTP